jgi:hypothetical protein
VRKQQPNKRDVHCTAENVKLLLLAALWYIIQSPGVVGEEMGKKKRN